MTQKIIYLNGTSSSGKSTVAKSLQAMMNNSVCVGADDFGEALEESLNANEAYQKYCQAFETLENQIKTTAGEQRELGLQAIYDLLNNNPLPLNLNSDLLMYHHVNTLDEFESIIIDDLIVTEYLFTEFMKIFSSQAVYLIEVDCELSELERREIQRGDRLPGSAHFWRRVVKCVSPYDLVIDTSQGSPEENASRILAHVDAEVPLGGYQWTNVLR